MSSSKAVPHSRGWVKVTAALILLAGLLLGGILAAPAPAPVQALNALPQIMAPQGPVPSSVSGTLASFTALFPQVFTVNLPYVAR